MVVPILVGAGARIKIAEAFARKSYQNRVQRAFAASDLVGPYEKQSLVGNLMNSSSSEVPAQRSQNLEAEFADDPSSVIAEDDFLDTRKLLKNLKERSVRGAAITFSAQAIKFGLTTA